MMSRSFKPRNKISHPCLNRHRLAAIIGVIKLTAIIKCPQCRGESIKDSSAVTARTMREMVAEQVAAGRTDDEVLDFFRGLYGDQAILDPGLTASTVVLWAVPALVLAGGIGAVVWLSKVRDR